MKKITSLCLLFVIASYAVAQETHNFNRTIIDAINKVDSHQKPLKIHNGPSDNSFFFQAGQSSKHTGAPRQAMDSVIADLWDPQEELWIVNHVMYFHFDAKGNNDLYHDKVLNEESGQLEDAWKMEFTYNNAGKITQSLDYSWSSTAGEWILEWKTDVTYNGNGNIFKINGYEWDDSNGEWTNSWKDENEYNGAGQLIRTTSYEWDDPFETWLKFRRSEYSYDNLGNWVLEINSSCLNGIDLWVNDNKTEFQFDNNQNLFFETFYLWEEGQWNKVEGKEYTYDGNNRVVAVKELDWNGTGWFNYSMVEYEYDQYDNMVFMQISDWNDNVLQFEPSAKGIQEYNNDYDKSVLLLPWYFAEEDDVIEPFNHMLLSTTQQLFNGTGWDNLNRIMFHYSEVDVDAIHDLKTNRILASPNPFADEVRISANNPITRVMIMDPLGKLVFDLKTGGDKEVVFPTGNLSSGLYICRLVVKGKLHTLRLIKAP